MLVWFLILTVSLVVLVAASERLTRAAKELAVVLRVPSVVIGATIVSLGTTAPELFTGITAVLRGTTEIVAANAVGSNIFNATVILGIAAIMVRKVHLDGWKRTVLAAATAGVLALMLGDGVVSRSESAVLVVIGVAALALLLRGNGGLFDRFRINRGSVLAATLTILVAGVVLAAASGFAVESVVRIAAGLRISPSLVALFALAAGTSLPELFVSLSSVRHRMVAVSLGNILGANILNATLVVGLPGLLGGTLVVAPVVLAPGILFLLATAGILALLSFRKKIGRGEGVLLLLFYLLFAILVLEQI